MSVNCYSGEASVPDGLLHVARSAPRVDNDELVLVYENRKGHGENIGEVVAQEIALL